MKKSFNKQINFGIYSLVGYLITFFLASYTSYSQTVQPFFVTPISNGLVEVRLYPTENVSVGSAKLVTFGMPFTRGAIKESNLKTVRILTGNTSSSPELPAYVAETTPWRHATDINIDNQSVRIAKVQFNYTFTVSYPNYETVYIEYGTNYRGSNVSVFQNPKTDWHIVNSGSFLSSDNISEPDVFAVFPKEFLSDGALKLSRMLPIDNSIPLTRENPAVVDNASYNDYGKHDHAVHNFFFSIINEDDPLVTVPNQCAYKTDFEPWLYDRSTAMYNLYMRSGNFKALREAVRNAQFYKSKLYDNSATPLNAKGLFKLKTPNSNLINGSNDAMYSYNECLAYTYWLVSDDDMYNPIEWVVSAHELNSPTNRWAPSSSSWTERFTSFKLIANTVAYEVTGLNVYKDSMLSHANSFIWLQNGASGQIPATRIDGGLYHYGSQHGDGTATQLVASSWMTALVSESMVRVYALTEDISIANFIKRVGNFEKTALKFDANHIYTSIYPSALWYGDYMMRYDGVTDDRDGTEIDHSMDISVTLAWAAYFSAVTGALDYSLLSAAENAYQSYNIGVNYWIRPTAPSLGSTAYRVNPWRKYGWEYTPSASFTWLMSDLNSTIPTIVNEHSLSDKITIYPNPSNSILNIKFNNALSRKVFVYNVLGDMVLEKILNESENHLSVEKLNTGIYFIAILDENGTTKMKFVKD